MCVNILSPVAKLWEDSCLLVSSEHLLHQSTQNESAQQVVIDGLAAHEVPNSVVFVATSLSLWKGTGNSKRRLQ